VEFGFERAAAILQRHDVIAQIDRLADSALDAAFGSHAADQQGAYATGLELGVKVGAGERPKGRLVDHYFVLGRGQLGQDLKARLALGQDAAHGAWGALFGARGAALFAHGIGQVGQVRLKAVAGLGYRHGELARRIEHRPNPRHTSLQGLEIEMPAAADALVSHKIVLHVDDEPRGRGGVEGECPARPTRNFDHC